MLMDTGSPETNSGGPVLHFFLPLRDTTVDTVNHYCYELSIFSFLLKSDRGSVIFGLIVKKTCRIIQ